MEDRDLTQLTGLAAKAIGIEHSAGDHSINGPAVWDCKKRQWWRPLTDDGDALRLAVRLNLQITIEEQRCAAITVAWGEDFDFHVCEQSLSPDAPQAATRLAIVRAAAEIGKAMP